MSDIQYFTYIIASDTGTLYIGMTNDLQRRIQEHKEWEIEWFSKKYNCKKLIYYETTKYVHNAIEREKELKNWNRSKKEELIKTLNPTWKDLYEELFS